MESELNWRQLRHQPTNQPTDTNMLKIGTEKNANLIASFSELTKIKVYAESILREVEEMKKSPYSRVHDLELEMMFNRSQAIADYSKIASKRLGRKPRRKDHLGLVKLANETADHTV